MVGLFEHYWQPHDELTAPVRSFAERLRRSTVHLNHSLNQRQTDTEPTLRALQGRIDLREHVKMWGSISGGMPMPVSSTATITSRPIPGRSALCCRRRGELTGVVEEVTEHLREATRVRIQLIPLLGQRDRNLMVTVFGQRADALHRLVDDRCQFDRRLRSSSLSRVMRLISRRSAINRTMWPNCR